MPKPKRYTPKKEKKQKEAAKEELDDLMKKKELEVEAIKQKAEQAERIADAMEGVEEMISRIRRKGGDVTFDGDQLQRLLEGSGFEEG